MDSGLSDDVLGAILLWLGPKSISAVRLVCQRWRDVHDQLHLEVSPRDWLQGLSGLLRVAPRRLVLSYGSESNPDQEAVDFAWSQLCLQLNTCALSHLEVYTSTKDLLRFDLALQLARRAGPSLETLVVSGAPLAHRGIANSLVSMYGLGYGGPGEAGEESSTEASSARYPFVPQLAVPSVLAAQAPHLWQAVLGNGQGTAGGAPQPTPAGAFPNLKVLQLACATVDLATLLEPAPVHSTSSTAPPAEAEEPLGEEAATSFINDSAHASPDPPSSQQLSSFNHHSAHHQQQQQQQYQQYDQQNPGHQQYPQYSNSTTQQYQQYSQQYPLYSSHCTCAPQLIAPALQELSLNNCCVAGCMLGSVLAGMTGLTVLKLTGCTLDPADFEEGLEGVPQEVRYPGTSKHYGEAAVAAGTTHGSALSGPRPRVAIWSGLSEALPNLQALEMSMCKLLLLPPALLGLTRLQSLELQMNFMTTLPAGIGALTALTHLNIAYNPVSAIPDSLSRVTRLASLDLRGTKLSTYPPVLSRLTGLVDLRCDLPRGERLTPHERVLAQVLGMRL